MIDADVLAAAWGRPRATCALWAPHIALVCLAYGIDSVQRLADFLGQTGHESGCGRWVREIWGPTAQQLRYEGTDLARRLGNTEPGDGARFKGRGLIQLTGRANYRALAPRLRNRFRNVPDFEAEPQALEQPQWAAASAGDFWEGRALNALADAGDFAGETRRINGGFNGLADRQRLRAAALAALTIGNAT